MTKFNIPNNLNTRALNNLVLEAQREGKYLYGIGLQHRDTGAIIRNKIRVIRFVSTQPMSPIDTGFRALGLATGEWFNVITESTLEEA